VDCSGYNGRAGRELCSATAEACEVVFTDRAGCAATCAEAGLVCGETLENLDDACAGDRARPALDCAVDAGHGSDLCRCVRAADCSPECAPDQACGDDGCGGRCGPGCGPDARCEGGLCTDAPVAADCMGDRPTAASLLAERRGFGAGVTGGDPRNVYRVTSRQDGAPGSLRAGLESAESLYIVFDIEGEIRFDFDDPIRPLSNKTVDGRGRDVRLRDVRIDIRNGARNLIFSDFEAYFNDPQDNVGDLFSLLGEGGDNPADYAVRDIWFHHLDLHHAGDGLIDVRGATNITLSWSHLHDHTKAMLHTTDSEMQPSPGMRITYHHNFFDTLSRRSPHFAYGMADFYNNYHKHWYEYGAASIDDARFLSEANVYEARPGEVCVIPCPDPAPHGGGNDFFVSKKAVVNDWAPVRSDGFVKSVGDLLLNGALVATRQPERVFDRADFYVSAVEPATPELARRIEAGAGPRTTLCR
jgi:pectate lyase